jgi:hypothetical protein
MHHEFMMPHAAQQAACNIVALVASLHAACTIAEPCCLHTTTPEWPYAKSPLSFLLSTYPLSASPTAASPRLSYDAYKPELAAKLGSCMQDMLHGLKAGLEGQPNVTFIWLLSWADVTINKYVQRPLVAAARHHCPPAA